MTDRYAVIGNPIAQTKSPLLHAAFARQFGHDMTYEAILGPIGGFAEAVRAFRAAGGKGMNVTVPFKVEALELADRLTERARLAQAVNTLKFDEEGILGENTDGVGLVRDIQGRVGVALRGKRILLLGAGGAARGALLPLLAEQPSRLVIANRTPAKAEALRDRVAMHGDVAAGGFSDFAGEQFDVVINATSASLSGADVPLPVGTYAAGSLAYDLVYGKGNTPFMSDALENGAGQVADGLGILVAQAAEAFWLWRGVRPDVAPVIEMFRVACSSDYARISQTQHQVPCA